MKEDYLLKDNEVFQVRSDRLFHDLFNGHEMNTIEWTVMQILNKSYEEIHGRVTVGDSRLTNMSKNDKQKFVDLIVDFDDKRIIIELNNNYDGSFLRNTLYAMNIINNSYIDSGGYYEDKIQGILINLNWYKSKKRANYGRKEMIYEYPSDSKESDYLLKIININLDFYANKCYTEFAGVDKLSKLLTFEKKDELKEFTKKEKMLNEYYDKMERLTKDKEYCKMVWDSRIDEKLRNIDAYNGGKEDGIEEGIEQGIKQGIKQNQEQMILEFYKNNVSIDIIAKSSGLTVSEVEDIINSKS